MSKKRLPIVIPFLTSYVAVGPLAAVPGKTPKLLFQLYGQCQKSATAKASSCITDGGVGILLPKAFSAHSIFFLQANLNFDPNKQGTAAVGTGCRFLLDNDFLLGLNLFGEGCWQQRADALKATRGLMAFCIGQELQWKGVQVTNQLYLPINTKNARKAATGFDLQLATTVPMLPWFRVLAKTQQYFGEEVQYYADHSSVRNPKQHSLGMDLTPIPLLNLTYRYHFGEVGASPHSVALKLTYKIGKPFAQQCALRQVRQLRTPVSHCYELVPRRFIMTIEKPVALVSGKEKNDAVQLLKACSSTIDKVKIEKKKTSNMLKTSEKELEHLISRISRKKNEKNCSEGLRLFLEQLYSVCTDTREAVRRLKDENENINFQLYAITSVCCTKEDFEAKKSKAKDANQMDTLIEEIISVAEKRNAVVSKPCPELIELKERYQQLTEAQGKRYQAHVTEAYKLDEKGAYILPVEDLLLLDIGCGPLRPALQVVHSLNELCTDTQQLEKLKTFEAPIDSLLKYINSLSKLTDQPAYKNLPDQAASSLPEALEKSKTLLNRIKKAITETNPDLKEVNQSARTLLEGQLAKLLAYTAHRPILMHKVATMQPVDGISFGLQGAIRSWETLAATWINEKRTSKGLEVAQKEVLSSLKTHGGRLSLTHLSDLSPEATSALLVHDFSSKKSGLDRLIAEFKQEKERLLDQALSKFNQLIKPISEPVRFSSDPKQHVKELLDHCEKLVHGYGDIQERHAALIPSFHPLMVTEWDKQPKLNPEQWSALQTRLAHFKYEVNTSNADRAVAHLAQFAHIETRPQTVPDQPNIDEGMQSIFKRIQTDREDLERQLTPSGRYLLDLVNTDPFFEKAVESLKKNPTHSIEGKQMQAYASYLSETTSERLLSYRQTVDISTLTPYLIQWCSDARSVDGQPENENVSVDLRISLINQLDFYSKNRLIQLEAAKAYCSTPTSSSSLLDALSISGSQECFPKELPIREEELKDRLRQQSNEQANKCLEQANKCLIQLKNEVEQYDVQVPSNSVAYLTWNNLKASVEKLQLGKGSEAGYRELKRLLETEFEEAYQLFEDHCTAHKLNLPMEIRSLVALKNRLNDVCTQILELTEEREDHALLVNLQKTLTANTLQKRLACLSSFLPKGSDAQQDPATPLVEQWIEKLKQDQAGDEGLASLVNGHLAEIKQGKPDEKLLSELSAIFTEQLKKEQAANARWVELKAALPRLSKVAHDRGQLAIWRWYVGETSEDGAIAERKLALLQSILGPGSRTKLELKRAAQQNQSVSKAEELQQLINSAYPYEAAEEELCNLSDRTNEIEAMRTSELIRLSVYEREARVDKPTNTRLPAYTPSYFYSHRNYAISKLHPTVQKQIYPILEKRAAPLYVHPLMKEENPIGTVIRALDTYRDHMVSNIRSSSCALVYKEVYNNLKNSHLNRNAASYSLRARREQVELIELEMRKLTQIPDHMLSPDQRFGLALITNELRPKECTVQLDELAQPFTTAPTLPSEWCVLSDLINAEEVIQTHLASEKFIPEVSEHQKEMLTRSITKGLDQAKRFKNGLKEGMRLDVLEHCRPCKLNSLEDMLISATPDTAETSALHTSLNLGDILKEDRQKDLLLGYTAELRRGQQKSPAYIQLLQAVSALREKNEQFEQVVTGHLNTLASSRYYKDRYFNMLEAVLEQIAEEQVKGGTGLSSN